MYTVYVGMPVYMYIYYFINFYRKLSSDKRYICASSICLCGININLIRSLAKSSTSMILSLILK